MMEDLSRSPLLFHMCVWERGGRMQSDKSDYEECLGPHSVSQYLRIPSLLKELTHTMRTKTAMKDRIMGSGT